MAAVDLRSDCRLPLFEVRFCKLQRRILHQRHHIWCGEDFRTGAADAFCGHLICDRPGQAVCRCIEIFLICQDRSNRCACRAVTESCAFCFDLLRMRLDSGCLLRTEDLLSILRSCESDQSVDRDNICRDLLDQRFCRLILLFRIDSRKPVVCGFLCLSTAGRRICKCFYFLDHCLCFVHHLFLRSSFQTTACAAKSIFRPDASLNFIFRNSPVPILSQIF